jgi:putative (di)nucleoside polyphosphate hydrolase
MAKTPQEERTFRYRPNVAAIVRDPEGRILIGERSDVAGAWQFPQGGIDTGEASEQALVREVEEELGLRREHYRIVSSHGPYRYRFPEGVQKRGYDGQEQQYYLLDLTVPGSTVDVETASPEFRRVRWIMPGEFKIGWLPEMKKEVYRKVLRDIFAVETI